MAQLVALLLSSYHFASGKIATLISPFLNENGKAAIFKLQWLSDTVKESEERKDSLFGMIRLKVKEVAGSKGISMGKLSRIADVDIKTVRRIYRYPYQSITLAVLDRLAEALHVDATELIESTDSTQENDT